MYPNALYTLNVEMDTCTNYGSTVCLKSGNISWSARRAFVCVCFLYNGP